MAKRKDGTEIGGKADSGVRFVNVQAVARLVELRQGQNPIPCRAFVVGVALATFMDHKGMCWPARSALAKRARVSSPTVSLYLRLLRERGFMSVEHRPGKSPIYQLTCTQCGYNLPIPNAGTTIKGPVPKSGTTPVPDAGTGPVPNAGTQKEQRKKPKKKTIKESVPEPVENVRTDVKDVFEHHCRVMSDDGKPRGWHLTDEVRDKIRTRLKGFSPEQLKHAATILSGYDWNRGRDPKTQGKESCDPTFLYRSDAQVDKWLNMPARGALAPEAPYKTKAPFVPPTPEQMKEAMRRSKERLTGGKRDAKRKEAEPDRSGQ